ncbi:MAG: putative DNA-binding domain-containing protein [Rhizobiales bacterium]|nr:putative DNA-binding domain-containing protein [Hyphomicrobiales bacterium]
MTNGFKKIQHEITGSLLGNLDKIPDGLVANLAPNIRSRFSVYRNNVMSSLVDALVANYPIVYALVGDVFFKGLAVEFITKNPPQSTLLFNFGDGLVEFISEAEACSSIPYLADIAYLEVCWRKAYHAKDVMPIEADALQNIAPEFQMDLVFDIHPSASIIKSGWPIFSIWNGHETGNMDGVNLENTENILITRPVADVMMIAMDATECMFFRNIMNGETLGFAYEKSLENDSEFDLGHAFGQMFAMGLAIGLEVKINKGV